MSYPHAGNTLAISKRYASFMNNHKRRRLTIVDVYDGLMDLKAAVEHGFSLVEERSESRTVKLRETMWRRFDAHDERFDAMDKRFDAMDKRFDTMDKRFDSMDQRVDALEQRFDARFDQLEGRIGPLELKPAP